MIVEIRFMANDREIGSNGSRRGRIMVVMVVVVPEMKRRGFLLNFKRVKRQTGSLSTFHSGIPIILNFVVSSSG